ARPSEPERQSGARVRMAVEVVRPEEADAGGVAPEARARVPRGYEAPATLDPCAEVPAEPELAADADAAGEFRGRRGLDAGQDGLKRRRPGPDHDVEAGGRIAEREESVDLVRVGLDGPESPRRPVGQRGRGGEVRLRVRPGGLELDPPGQVVADARSV